MILENKIFISIFRKINVFVLLIDDIVIFPLFIGFKSSSNFKSSTKSRVIKMDNRQAPFKVPHRAYIEATVGFDAPIGRIVLGQLLAPQLCE